MSSSRDDPRNVKGRMQASTSRLAGLGGLAALEFPSIIVGGSTGHDVGDGCEMK